jgi:sirohydrochlorin cobaltochelatase
VALWNTGSHIRLCHRRDLERFGPDSAAGAAASPTHRRPVDARHLARLDADGKFRPLKSAPSLSGGWLLELSTVPAVREALDYFYPAAVALWLRRRDGEIRPTHLRETLNRQSGMYRIAALINDDEAIGLARDVCGPGKCARKILWDISPQQRLHLAREKRLEEASGRGKEPMPPRIPLLCGEACNLLVAAARGVVNKRTSREVEGSRHPGMGNK